MRPFASPLFSPHFNLLLDSVQDMLRIMVSDRGLHSLVGELHKICCKLLNKNRPSVIWEDTQQNNQSTWCSQDPLKHNTQYGVVTSF